MDVRTFAQTFWDGYSIYFVILNYKCYIHLVQKYALYVLLKEFFIVAEKSFETKHNLFDVWSFKSTVKQLVQMFHWSHKLKKNFREGGNSTIDAN